MGMVQPNDRVICPDGLANPHGFRNFTRSAQRQDATAWAARQMSRIGLRRIQVSSQSTGRSPPIHRR